MSSVCRKCASDVKTNQNGVACDLCSNWFHTKCVGISNEAYKFLQVNCISIDSAASDSQTPVNGGALWFCSSCIAPASKLIRNVSIIQHRQDELENELKQTNIRQCFLESEVKENKRALEDMQKCISTITEELSDIKTDLAIKQAEPSQWSDIVSQAVDDKLGQVAVEINKVEESIAETRKKAAEVKDLEDRSSNMILYRVPECPPGNYETVMKHDTEFCLDLCRDVLGVDMQSDDIVRVYCLGKRGESPRPLLVRLSSKLLKSRIMEYTYKLRNAEDFKNIIISYDMTKQQREECKKLVLEAKDRESNEPSGEYIFRVRGAPGEMKIVKIRRRQPWSSTD